jgi:alanyl-tRNA synthetase
MMKKLYYERPYVKSFEAKVLECRPGKDGMFLIILDQTAFYPEGGGQPSDRGTLGEVSVLDVREKSEEILHLTDKPLKEGSVVTGVIDWDRRFIHMQNHTGEHLLSGIVHKHYGFENVGFHMGKDEVTVDFDGVLTKEQLEKAEAEANDKIWQNVPVLESFPSKEELSNMDYRSKKELTGQVRIVEIPGGDICACCGTHVMKTGEIGILKVTGMKKYKGGVRVSMLCGKMAFMDYKKKQTSVSGISTLLSVKEAQVLDGVTKLKAEGVKKDGMLNQIVKELLVRKLWRDRISAFGF